MIKENDIVNFLNQYDYDIRKLNNARWIDQKCTPDVVSIVADCIIQYIKYNRNQEFTAKDIWKFKYTEENIRAIFNKPSTEDKSAENEYDKFFAQPLEMLAYSKILNKSKKGNKNIYSVNNEELLEFLSFKELFALKFIYLYCEKVLKDSMLWKYFKDFFDIQDKKSFKELKDSYIKFIIENTNINNEVEVRRIFTKVLNPLAYNYNSKGTLRGQLSKNKIIYSDLMYNRNNFRDIYREKPKEISRQEWFAKEKIQPNINLYKYQSNKAKRFLRKFNDEYRLGYSEVNDEFANGNATQVHHIFPSSEYPNISMYLENLIVLTPTQHFNKAHPMNNTHEIDREYQELILKSKAKSIDENIRNKYIETIYSFEKFIYVLNEGFNTNYDIENSNYEKAMSIILNYYSS